MRNALVLAVIAVAAACAAAVSGPPHERSATLDPVAESGVRAAAQTASAGGVTSAAISLAGGTSGATHPWHVHTGTCGSGGGIVGAASAYPPLRPGAGGNATATATVRVALLPGEAYHVNVHRSPTALNEIISCGNLR